MKLLFTVMLLIGFGFWMNKEIEHERELQTQLDDTRQALDEVTKRLAALQPPSRTSQQMKSAGNSNAQWMWEKDPNNPLNAPPPNTGQRR